MSRGKISQSELLSSYRPTTLLTTLKLRAGAPAGPAGAPVYTPLTYHNGLVLNQVEIVPVFWGRLSNAEVQQIESYLRGLAGYLSGDKAPAGRVPVLWQYGCRSASVLSSFRDESSPSPPPQMQPGATVTALVPRQDHIDLFATGSDGAVWSTWWEPGPGWQGWFLIHPEVKMQPGAEEIATHAYYLFEQRGRQHGDDLKDWFRAEDELTRGQ